jgi:hypothetical protein
VSEERFEVWVCPYGHLFLWHRDAPNTSSPVCACEREGVFMIGYVRREAT